MSRTSKIAFFIFAITAQTAFGLEVKDGDNFSGQIEVLQVLTEKAYNLEDPLCIQKSIFNSSQHNALIAIGGSIERIKLEGKNLMNFKGKRYLHVSADYFIPSTETEKKNVYFNTCNLLD